MQQTVIIQPAQPNTVYVPQYNPTTAYGAPVPAPPGYSGSDLLLTGVLSFGAGILLGSLINNGNNNWGCNWYGGGGSSSSVKYNNNVYVTNNNCVPGTTAGAVTATLDIVHRNGIPAPGISCPTDALSGRQAALQRRRWIQSSEQRSNSGDAAVQSGNREAVRSNNPNIAKPNFPKASTLPNNPARVQSEQERSAEESTQSAS